MPASAPDIIQKGSRVVTQPPMMPPAKHIKVLNATAESVLGLPKIVLHWVVPL